MANRWDRLGPLLGVIFVVLLVIDFALGGTEPTPDASAAQVVSWYGAHRGNVLASIYAMPLVLVTGLVFYGHLRDELADGGDGLAATAFGGAVLFAASGAAVSGVQLALAHSPHSLSAGSAHTLNLLANYTATIAMGAGAGVLLLAGSLAILRSARLPVWTGWLGLVFAVLALLPIRSLGPIPAGLWTLIVSVILLVRGSKVSTASRSGNAGAAKSGAY